MIKLVYEGIELAIKEDQTVLDALQHHGHTVPSNCRIGVCQSCMMRAISGSIPTAAQHGLKDTLKIQDYFLACQCIPDSTLEIVLPSPGTLRTTATIEQIQLLSKDVLHLKLRTDDQFVYQAGQYAMLWNSHAIGRCYSLASVPGLDKTLDLHIARVAGGRMTTWIFEELSQGDQVQLQMAAGDCFYVEGNYDQNILLAGTGTGLAPLWGIVRTALHKGHRGEIHLIHGAINAQGLYLHEELLELDRKFNNFFYHASILEGDMVSEQVTMGHIENLVSQVVPQPKDWRVYLCGAQEIVNSIKKKVFLSGASMANIYSDSFVNAGDRSDTA